MLTKSLEERLAFAAAARSKSQNRNATLSAEIMDVNQHEVEKLITEHGVDILLHGHTHRLAVHDIDLGKRAAQRIVLGDWYEQGSVLRWNDSGYSLDVMPR